ncbi:hypothetical protein [Streptomyces sp. NBC_01508]|uniref:hypothetical protein n=1 Tax=Streptomyces sp. NBC_01508 TaxID=2903888 RepID=UPI0038632226
MKTVTPWTPPTTTIELVAAGNVWDAVRVPARYGPGVISRLGTTTGAVIEDTHAATLYWLVHPGTADTWDLSPQHVSVLGAASYVAVPPPGEGKPAYRLRWAVPLTPTCYLTNAQALLTALTAEIETVSGSWGGDMAYCALLDHTAACAACNAHERCGRGDELRAAERAARTQRRVVPLFRGDPITPEDLGGEEPIRWQFRQDTCTWCQSGAEELVAVGLFHSASGPGWIIYACPPCLRRQNLLPLDQHPAGAWGGLLHSDGSPAGPPPPVS